MKTLDYDALHTAYTNQITTEIKNSAGTYRPFLTTTRFTNKIPLSASNMKQQYCFFTDSTWNQYSKTYRFIVTARLLHGIFNTIEI